MSEELSKANSPQAVGRAIYQTIWQIVASDFFDTTRLTDWHCWQNRFDEQIVDKASGLSFAGLMLQSLNDSFTCITAAPAAPVTPAAASASDEEPTVQAQAEDSARSVYIVQAPSGLAYLRIMDFDRDEIAGEIEAAVCSLTDCRGLYLDLRYNKGGRVNRAIQAAGLFIENGLIAKVAHRKDGVIGEKQFFVNETQFFSVETRLGVEQPAEFYRRLKPLLASKPLVVLTGPRTASAAELFAATLVQNGQAGQVCTVGGVTCGKGIGQVSFALPHCDEKLTLTTARWYCPSGDWLGDCGQTVLDPLVPEVLVEKDSGQEGLQAAADALKQIIAENEKSAA